MGRSKDEFVITAEKLIGPGYTIGNGTTELHFWCRHCIRGWRYVKPATPTEMTAGSLTHLVNHMYSHEYQARRKAAR